MTNTALLIPYLDKTIEQEQLKANNVYYSLQQYTKSILQGLLLSKNMSQCRLGQEIGVSKGYISQVVNGKREITNDIKIRIAKVLEVDSRVIWP